MPTIFGEKTRHEAFWHPRRVQERLEIAERYLREAKKNFGAIGLRFQPLIRVYANNRQAWRVFRGEAIILTIDEPVDVWDLWLDLKRFLRAWRPMRRRT